MNLAGEERKTGRCPHCQLNQFVCENSICRRCKKYLVVEESKKPPVEVVTKPVYIPGWGIGDRVRFFRGMRKMSQRELAQRVGCWRTYLSKVENGMTPRLGNLFKIAASMSVPVWYLAEEDPIVTFSFLALLKSGSEEMEKVIKWAESRAA